MSHDNVNKFHKHDIEQKVARFIYIHLYKIQKQVELIFGEVKTVISPDQVSTEKGMGNGASGVGECFLDQGAGYMDVLTLRNFIKL